MKTSPRDFSLGAQMSVASQLMKRVNHRALHEAGIDITLEQLGLLETLHVHGEKNMTELSQLVWKQNANVTRIVDKLEKKNFIERKVVPGDRRAFQLSITEPGIEIFENAIPVLKKAYVEIMEGISEEEHVLALTIVKKIISHLSK